MLIKAFHNWNGVFAAASETPSGGASAATEITRKPSNLAVRAAMKRKRLASSAAPKPEHHKPAP